MKLQRVIYALAHIRFHIAFSMGFGQAIHHTGNTVKAFDAWLVMKYIGYNIALVLCYNIYMYVLYAQFTLYM